MPRFYMMVGLPGSGKSQYAKSLNAAVHSSDAIRSEILGDENDQTQQELVFKTLHDRVLQDLKEGKDAVYDATNINYKGRMNFLKEVKALHIPSLLNVCVFMAVPYEVCLERNSNRGRRVPDSVIRRMYEKFDIPMFAEGWDGIVVTGAENRADQISLLIARLSRLEHDNPNHSYTIGHHCTATYQYLAGHFSGYSPALERAALLHDIGKPQAKVFHDQDGNPTEYAHYYNHERMGAYDSFCYTCDLSTEQRLTAALLIRWHMWPYVVEKSENPIKTAKKAVRLLGKDIWNQIIILNNCDRHAH